MKTLKWTKQEEEYTKERLKAYGEDPDTFTMISYELARKHKKDPVGFPTERTGSAVRRKCIREGWFILPDKEIKENEPETFNPWTEILELQKKYQADCILNTRGVMKPTKATTKILSLSDIHFPLARMDLLEQAISNNLDADIIVVNGDIIDGFMFSKFEKSKSIAALDEYRTAFYFIKSLSEFFPKVVLSSGNHDARVSLALQRAGLNKDASSVLRPDLIARIANGEELDDKANLIKKHDFSNVIYQRNESWYVRIGKTLFIHPHGDVGSGTGATVRKWAGRFNSRYPYGEIDSFVCGHTHMLSKAVVNNQLLIEQGCLCDFMSYAWSATSKYSSSAQNGYAVIYQDSEGNCDFNRSGPIYLGEILPPKKSVI